MNKKILSFAAVVLMSIGGNAFAQDRNAPPPRANPPTQEFTFTDQLVQSDLQRPDLTTVRGGRQRSSINLLRVRSHFVQEMFKSVENL
jgi:hypothetical protein